MQTASDTSTFRVKTPGVVTSDSSQATQRPTRKPRDFELPEPPMAKPLPNLPPPNTPLVYSVQRTVQLDTPTSEDSPGESGSGGVKSPTKLSLKLSKLRQRLLNRSHSTPANELPTIRSQLRVSIRLSCFVILLFLHLLLLEIGSGFTVSSGVFVVNVDTFLIWDTLFDQKNESSTVPSASRLKAPCSSVGRASDCNWIHKI